MPEKNTFREADVPVTRREPVPRPGGGTRPADTGSGDEGASGPESDACYRLLFDGNPHPMWVYDVETLAFLAVNEAAVRHYGYTRDEFLAMSIADIRPPEDVPAMIDDVASHRGATHRESGVWRHRRKNGTVIDVEIASNSLPFGGRPARLVMASDITERVQLAEAVRLAETKFRDLFENAVEGIFQTSPAGHYLAANPALARIYGFGSPAEMVAGLTDIGQQLYVEPGRREEFARLMREDGSVSGFESQVRRRDGSVIWISESSRGVRDGSDRLLYYEGIVEDVSGRKRAEEALRRVNAELAVANERLAALATVDGLTGLANVRHFRELLEAGVALAGREGLDLSVVMLDLDGFKAYNDTYGHPAGDEALRSVAEVLSAEIRAHDVAARYGGEEFVVLAAGADAADGKVLAERLRAAIAAREWPLRAVTASLGVATLRPGMSEGMLLAAADRALYRSKESGRDRVTHVHDLVSAPCR